MFRFFFLYSKKGATKPDRVAYLQPGKFTVKKTKQKGVCALRFEAPLVMKGKKFGKELKFMLGASDAGNRDSWVDAFMTQEIKSDEAGDIMHEKADDAISHFDFEVTVKGQLATLTVTKESLKIFQKGKMIAEHKIKQIKSWSVGADKIIFKLNAGGSIAIDTVNGNGIKDALVGQAKGIIQAQKDAKVAKAEVEAAAEEAAAVAAAEVAEETLRWLTHDELRTGNYERYTAAGSRQGDVDEKNKELLLTDAEFQTAFGMTKEAFAKKPAFQKPLLKKKLGLGPYQFNE